MLEIHHSGREPSPLYIYIYTDYTDIDIGTQRHRLWKEAVQLLKFMEIKLLLSETMCSLQSLTKNKVSGDREAREARHAYS